MVSEWSWRSSPPGVFGVLWSGHEHGECLHGLRSFAVWGLRSQNIGYIHVLLFMVQDCHIMYGYCSC